ncbi:MAG: hypothetical protein OEY56_01450 [Cyclobacteriaceae bacterium]|nr:hypothetical protein [Cyclobacteriaceae bacterium]
MIFRNPHLQKGFSYLLILSLTLYLTGCTYYKAREKPISETPVLDLDKYNAFSYTFVAHLGNEEWDLSSVVLNRYENKILAEVKEVDERTKYMYESLRPGQTARYSGTERNYIRQVHIYMTEYEDMGNNRITIDGENIQKVLIYNMNGALTTLSYLSTGAVTFVAGMIIILLILCNCPHVYTFDGNEYIFTSTLFTGAVTPALARHDYKILPDYQPDKETYQLKVINEEYENQYTDLLEMLAVYHQPDEKVVPDKVGKIHVLKQLLKPDKASTPEGMDLTYEVSSQDEVAYLFDAPSETDLNYVNLTFQKPMGTKAGRLVLTAKNSPWGGYVYKEMSSLLGKKYGRRVEKNQQSDGTKTNEWMNEQGMLLSVEMKNGDNWELVDEVPLLGDVSFQSIVIPVQFPDDETTTASFRLRAGFKFWEVDYVAMDYGNDLAENVDYLTPSFATGNDGSDHLAALQYVDHQYMEHLRKGDHTIVHFEPKGREKGLSRTLILHSNGYYRSNLHYEGRPQVREILKFRQPGELSNFSRKLYEDFSNSFAIN